MQDQSPGLSTCLASPGSPVRVFASPDRTLQRGHRHLSKVSPFLGRLPPPSSLCLVQKGDRLSSEVWVKSS